MPTTLTLKNIPDDVYERLKLAAGLHRRSLNSEAIVCLEAVLVPARITPGERIARARKLRAQKNCLSGIRIGPLRRCGAASSEISWPGTCDAAA